MSEANVAACIAETPDRKRARMALAIMNSCMTGTIALLTIGPWTAVIGALVMGALPYAPVLWRIIPAWAQANILAAGVAVFLICAILGTIIWGFSVAFYLALALVPVMLGLIPAIALSNPPLSELD
jgi:hypothetical protein